MAKRRERISNILLVIYQSFIHKANSIRNINEENSLLWFQLQEQEEQKLVF